MSPDCPHTPKCPLDTTRFACSQRTTVEKAVLRGLIERASGERLLKKYHVPMTPISTVYRGQKVTREPITDSLWPKDK